MSAAANQTRKRILHDYRISRTLGEGAFSKVKLAVHRQTELKVAIKFIKKEDKKDDNESIASGSPSPTRSPSRSPSRNASVSGSGANISVPSTLIDPAILVSNLTKEVRLLMRLDHPNVIKMYQVFDTDAELCIVMEHAKGELIDYIAATGSLSEREARKYFRQLISALQHCHAAGVVHRDLKLENLLLSHEKNLLLSDFGLGRTILSSEQTLGTFCGTPLYAAPELVSATRYSGPPVDVWSMGVVLYIMCSGKPPFQAANIGELYKRIKGVNYMIPDKFSPELRDLLSLILVRDPAARATLDKIRSHIWVNIGYDDLPLLHLPAVLLDDVKEDQIDKMISHIVQKPGYVAYTIRSAQGMFSRGSDDEDQVAPLPNIKQQYNSGDTSLPSQEIPYIEPVAPVFDRGRRHSVATTAPSEQMRALSIESDASKAIVALAPAPNIARPTPMTVTQAQVSGRVRRYSVAVDAPLALPTIGSSKTTPTPIQVVERGRRHSVGIPSVLGSPQPDPTVQDPATLRSLRFAFTDTTTTNKFTPLVLWNKLIEVLETMKPAMTFEQVGQWTTSCKFAPDPRNPKNIIVFEAEVCKVWLLKLNGVRMKRLSGNALEYKTIYEKVVRLLNL